MPAVVDIMVIELNSPIPVHFSSLIPRTSTFTPAISCLITSNLPWFMDLTFQIPMEYCSLQYWTLLLSLVTSTAGYYFCFGSIPSFFLELFLHWSPVAYWSPTDLGSSSFSVLSFCLFMLFIWFPRQEYWGGLPFPSPVAVAIGPEKVSFLSNPKERQWQRMFKLPHNCTHLTN